MYHKHYFGTTLQIHNTISTKSVAKLFTSIPTHLLITVFRSPYRPVGSALVIYSSVFTSCQEHTLLSCYFPDTVLAFAITSSFDTFRYTLSLDTLKFCNHGCRSPLSAFTSITLSTAIPALRDSDSLSILASRLLDSGLEYVRCIRTETTTSCDSSTSPN